MKDYGFASPSSKYFTKGKKLVSKGRGLLKELTKSQTPKSAQKNKAIAVLEADYRRFVVKMPQIQGFSNKNSIILTDDRMRQINRKSQVDAETSINYENRRKLQNFYIDTAYNPFTYQLTYQQLSQRQKNARRPLTERGNLIAETQRLKNQQVKLQLLKNKMVNVQNISHSMHIKIKQQKIRNPTRSVDSHQLHEFSFSFIEGLGLKDRQPSITWIDEMVNMKQESFFQLRNKQPKNIFGLWKNKNHADFQSNKQVLQRAHFNFDSMVTVPKKEVKRVQINPLLQISTFSREIMLNQKKSHDILYPSHLMLDISALQFTDMMYLASSRLNQYNFYQHLNENMQTNNQEQEEEIVLTKKKKKINRKENTVDRTDNCVPATNDKTEINYYNISQLISTERQQVKISNRFKDKLKKLLQEEISTVKSGILDKDILDTFRMAMNQTLLAMLDQNAQQYLGRKRQEMYQRIRWNKVHKNRSQNIKIREVVDTLKLKRQYHKVTSRFVSPSHRKSTFD